MQVPDDLIEYLRVMITPPKEFPGEVLYIPEMGEGITFGAYPDSSLNGIIARGTPSEGQAAEMLRAVKPGAMILLIAPETQPTGHTGCIRLEDAGGEVRDAILLVQEPGRLHYVPKASRAEREAGCENLPAKSGAAAVDREEGTEGLNSPRAGAGRTASQVRNSHPTVKPIETMVALLRDIPVEDGPVLDPFMGSGTTGIACLKTGHDFIGIEREAEYLAIADARIRHADYAAAEWDSATIESDCAPVVKTPEKFADMDDYFEDL